MQEVSKSFSLQDCTRFRKRGHPELKLLLFMFQLFDRKFLDAVLNEWQKTIMDLPAGIRQAFEMVIPSYSFSYSFIC